MLQDYLAGTKLIPNGSAKAHTCFLALTQREREVLFVLLDADNAKLVANKLAISKFTVSQHLRSIYIKLGVNTKLEAAILFLAFAHCLTKKEDCKELGAGHCEGVTSNIKHCFFQSLFVSGHGSDARRVCALGKSQ